MADELSGRLRKRLASGFVLDASFDIPLGESPVTILFGRSGSGKTSLLRLLSGLDAPDDGAIQFRDQLWYDAARGISRTPQQRRTGFLFQHYALFPHLTVAENIAFAARGEKRREFLKAF